MYLNRTICDVLSEMRKAHETRNYSYLLSLIEEAQSMANRMEAKLSDRNDIKDNLEWRKKLNKEVSKLREEKTELEEKIEKLKKEAKKCQS